MSLRLKRSGGGAPVVATLLAALAVMLLAAVMFALFPAVAEAQAEDKSTSSEVVRPERSDLQGHSGQDPEDGVRWNRCQGR